MKNFTFDNDTMVGTVILGGRLTIENLPEIKQTLIEALTKTDNLVLNHNTAEEFDFSYIQLLLSLVRTSENLNKKFTVAEGCPENFRSLFIKSGLADVSLISKTFLN